MIGREKRMCSRGALFHRAVATVKRKIRGVREGEGGENDYDTFCFTFGVFNTTKCRRKNSRGLEKKGDPAVRRRDQLVSIC